MSSKKIEIKHYRFVCTILIITSVLCNIKTATMDNEEQQIKQYNKKTLLLLLINEKIQLTLKAQLSKNLSKITQERIDLLDYLIKMYVIKPKKDVVLCVPLPSNPYLTTPEILNELNQFTKMDIIKPEADEILCVQQPNNPYIVIPKIFSELNKYKSLKSDT